MRYADRTAEQHARSVGERRNRIKLAQVTGFHGEQQVARLDSKFLDPRRTVGGKIETHGERRVGSGRMRWLTVARRQAERRRAQPLPLRDCLCERAAADIAVADEDHTAHDGGIGRQTAVAVERNLRMGEREADEAAEGAEIAGECGRRRCISLLRLSDDAIHLLPFPFALRSSALGETAGSLGRVDKKGLPSGEVSGSRLLLREASWVAEMYRTRNWYWLIYHC